jgi:uncharacterized YccA/Bax inhibitor family protein
VRTSNPALNEAAFNRTVPAADLRPGWGAPIPPAPDEVSPWTPSLPGATMTIGGAVSATAVLLVLLCAAGFVGWVSVEDQGLGGVELPSWLFLSMLVGIGAMIATIFRPQWARVTGPLYALGYGTVVGAISHLYEREFDGIVLQAVVGTVGVLAIMLFLYATRIVEVTDKLRMGIVMATGAVALMYLLSLVFRLFGAEVPFLHDTGTIGILVSVAIVVVASLNLLLDFDFVERAVAAKAPKSTEWYAAFGLVVTLVWLYLELLRLLSKLQRE